METRKEISTYREPLSALALDRPFPSSNPHLSSLLLFLKLSKLMVVLARHLLRIHAPLLRRLVILVKVARISRVSELRDDWTFDFAVIKGVPVDGAEEGVRFDLVDAASKVPETVSRVHGAEPGDEGSGVGVHVGGKFDFAYADSVIGRRVIRIRLGSVGA